MLRCNHLDDIELSYFEHMKRSLQFSLWALSMSVICLVHSALPWLFTETFSNSVLRLASKLENEQRKRDEELKNWL